MQRIRIVASAAYLISRLAAAIYSPAVQYQL